MVPPQRGWNLLARLKADPDLAAVPVIVVSPLEERNKALDLGAAELLVKPLDRRRLSAALERCSGTEGPMALVVEGDPGVREMLRRTLERVGWRVVEAENGVQGLRSLSEHRPRFVILDLPLPALDGFAFLRELRKSPDARSAAVLLLTNRRLTPGEERSVGPVIAVLEKGLWTLEEFRREVENVARSQCSRA
jgi:DNA-binding response OmpR family regulator